MGSIAFSEKEKIWTLSYGDGVNCPFGKGRQTSAGTLECMNCPSFISVDRDRNSHTTVLKCRGNPSKSTFRTILEKK